MGRLPQRLSLRLHGYADVPATCKRYLPDTIVEQLLARATGGHIHL
jgi:hypothetical protein